MKHGHGKIGFLAFTWHSIGSQNTTLALALARDRSLSRARCPAAEHSLSAPRCCSVRETLSRSQPYRRIGDPAAFSLSLSPSSVCRRSLNFLFSRTHGSVFCWLGVYVCITCQLFYGDVQNTLEIILFPIHITTK